MNFQASVPLQCILFCFSVVIENTIKAKKYVWLFCCSRNQKANKMPSVQDPVLPDFSLKTHLLESPVYKKDRLELLLQFLLCYRNFSHPITCVFHMYKPN